MLTAKQQTHFDNVRLLAKTIRDTKSNGRHDELGNPVICVELYSLWASDACDGVEWCLSEIKQLQERLRASLRQRDAKIDNLQRALVSANAWIATAAAKENATP